MIDSFLRSWDLLHNAYVAGWLIAVLLSLVGVAVVARDQIFLGAAVAEASAFGIAFGMWLRELESFRGAAWLGSDAALSVFAVAFSVLASVVTARGSGNARGSTEAVTGWVFLVSGSVSILLLAHNPHGLEEVHGLSSSSIVVASGADVWIFAALTALACAGAWLLRRRILLVIVDEEMARSLGIHTRAWNIGLCCLLGLAVGLSLRVSGVLYTVGCLVLPALAARNLTRNALPVFVLAPVLALGSTVAAFVVANYESIDLPPGQCAVAIMGGLVAVLSLLKAAGAFGRDR